MAPKQHLTWGKQEVYDNGGCKVCKNIMSMI
jgi:hypothetical protein